MAAQKPLIPEAIHQYITAVSRREPDLLRRLREESAADPEARKAIIPESGQFLALLIRLMGARKTIEIGVFMGYSSLWVAQALPPEGRMIACDVSEPWTDVARKYWKEAGVDGKIELHLRPAMETLRELVAEGEKGTYDFVFIDADKSNYDNYFELALDLLRPGGLIAVDNVLWSGRLIDPAVQDADTIALRAFNQKLHADPRVAITLVPMDDGMMLALKL